MENAPGRGSGAFLFAAFRRGKLQRQGGITLREPEKAIGSIAGKAKTVLKQAIESVLKPSKRRLWVSFSIRTGLI